MKIHLGCGTVYLKNYCNIDANPDYLVEQSADKDNSIILNANITTFENYYNYDFCKGSGKIIADLQADISELPFSDESVDEVVMLHVLEHIPTYNIQKVLGEISRVLSIGGKFYVAVPDFEKTCEQLLSLKNTDHTPEQEDWYYRLVFGTQKNKWAHHYQGFNDRRLKELLTEYSFGDFKILPNINFYPAIHMTAKKLNKV